MALPWLRLYTEFSSDPKIQIMAFEDQRHFIMLLCLKGNGTLDSDCISESYRERLIAKALGLDPIAAGEAKRRLLEGGLIDEHWHPIAWENRQFDSDSSTDRVRKYREKQRGNVTETLQERPCNAIDKKRRDKTREDTDKTIQGAPAPVDGLDEAAWRTWEGYRKASGKTIKAASISAARRKLASFGADQAKVVENSIAEGYQGLFASKTNGRPPEKRAETEWAALNARATSIGFRPPLLGESPGAYKTQMNQFEIVPRGARKLDVSNVLKRVSA